MLTPIVLVRAVEEGTIFVYSDQRDKYLSFFIHEQSQFSLDLRVNTSMREDVCNTMLFSSFCRFCTFGCQTKANICKKCKKVEIAVGTSYLGMQ